MIKSRLTQVQQLLQGTLLTKDSDFTGISIDSRTVKKDELFVAVKGCSFDGHDFVEKAYQNGAKAAIVSKPCESSIPQLVVQDTLVALGDLARWYRNEFKGFIIGLTGSCGKTTTKTLIAEILKQKGKVHATVGTLNNEYGVPLTLLRMPLDCDYGVIEMGANHFQEIAYLTHITKPNIALITNAGPVHLEGFESIEGVGRGKGEIFEGLASDGIAIINSDDSQANYWLSLLAGQRYVTFGLNTAADITAKNIVYNAESQTTFELKTLTGSVSVDFQLVGEHNVYNALAAAAVTYALNLPIDLIKQGLESAQPVDKRFVLKQTKQGATLLDDTYNANPVAMEMALKVLSHRSAPKVLVIGDMRELGENSIFYHKELGEKAKAYGVDKLFAVGEFTAYTVASFGDNAYHFSSQEDLIQALMAQIQKEMVILVKGSRGSHMENVINALI